MSFLKKERVMDDTSKSFNDIPAEEKRQLVQKLLQSKNKRYSSIAQTFQKKKDKAKFLSPEPSSDLKGIPLSFAQHRLWFIEKLAPGQHQYNVHRCLNLYKSLNLSVLECSLREIISRHGTLRTTFDEVEGQAIQIIAPVLPLSLPLVDLQELSEARRTPEMLRVISQEVQRPFDLTRGPLLRLMLFRVRGQHHILLINHHHIITDNWSVGIFVHELITLYEAYSTGKPSPLPGLPVQYADFALWQRQRLQGELLQKQLDYWKRKLADTLPMLALPTDHPRPAAQTFRGASLPLRLSQELSKELRDLSKRERATLFMTLLAAFQVLLFRYSGQQDLVVGSVIANRTRPELEGLIGFFANTLALRTDLSGNPHFREVLQRVKKGALEAYDHQDLPFEKLVEELRPQRDLSFNPLFQVMFVLQNAPQSPRTQIVFSQRSFDVDPQASVFDLTLMLTDTKQGIHGFFKYNTDLFEKNTISRMAAHLSILLEGIVAQPEKPVATLAL